MGGKKVIASTDPSLGLPLISMDWVRNAYVPSQGSIKEIEIEMGLLCIQTGKSCGYPCINDCCDVSVKVGVPLIFWHVLCNMN